MYEIRSVLLIKMIRMFSKHIFISIKKKLNVTKISQNLLLAQSLNIQTHPEEAMSIPENKFAPNEQAYIKYISSWLSHVTPYNTSYKSKQEE